MAFAKWILAIGNGELGNDNDGEADIDIPDDILISDCIDPLATIVAYTCSYLLDNISNYQFFEDRAILVPTLEIVIKVNNHVLELFPGEEKVYLSSDFVCPMEIKG